MKELSEEFETIKEEILSILKNLPHFDKLVFVCLFGSQAKKKSTKKSDIDICCYYDLDKNKLNEFSIKINSAFPERYDVSLFQLLPLQVRKEVLEGVLLYLSNRKKVYDVVYKTIIDLDFYRPLYKMVIE